MKRVSRPSRLFPTWTDHQRHALIGIRKMILQELSAGRVAKPGELVVDAGCGDSPYRQLFLDRGCLYFGCDIDGRPDVYSGSSTLPFRSSSADGVVSFQVLEHVWDLDAYLRECLRVLKPSGWLLLSTHGVWLYHPHPTDFRRWTRDGLIQEVQERGFTIESVHSAVGPLAWTTQFRLLGYRHAFQKMGLPGRLGTKVLSTLMNLRMVVEDAITPQHIIEQNACVYALVARKDRRAQ